MSPAVPGQRPQKVVILTGSELRHAFFRQWIALSPGLEVVRTYCEGLEKSLGTLIAAQSENGLRLMHLRAREQSEEDFFRVFTESVEDRSHPHFLPKGEINSSRCFEEITRLVPDLIVCYGSSIIREPLLSGFPKRFVNIHLGLSPYYRGSGTNYWPLVNGEPEFVGATFMHIDAGVDTGEIIHQIRARIAPGDTPAQIGNRLIVDMARTCWEIVSRWDRLKPQPQPATSARDRVYKKKDYTEASVAKLYANFREGLVSTYLVEEIQRCAAAPLVRNPVLGSSR